MRTEEIKIYEFEELPEESKEKAIEKHRRINVNYEWYDYLLDQFIRDAEELGIDINRESGNISFSIDRDAHFGVSRKSISVNNNILEKYDVYVSITGVKKIGYYFSDFPVREWSGTDLRAITLDEAHNTETGEIVEGEEELEEIEEMVRSKFYEFTKLCKEYYGRIKEDYYTLLKDDAVEETLVINDYEFTSDGEIYA